eukprot:1158897-Pelagomonas_calceolata.AAC.2
MLVTLRAWRARVERSTSLVCAAATNTLFADPSLPPAGWDNSNNSNSNNNSSNNNIEQSCQPSMETLGALHSMLEESVASGRLPAPQQQATGLPQLSVQGLSVPTALMALLVRAHAHEHSVHVGNVACRLLPMGSSCATSGGVRGAFIVRSRGGRAGCVLKVRIHHVREWVFEVCVLEVCLEVCVHHGGVRGAFGADAMQGSGA